MVLTLRLDGRRSRPALLQSLPLRGSTGLPLPADFVSLGAADAEEELVAGVAATCVEDNGQDGGQTRHAIAVHSIVM